MGGIIGATIRSCQSPIPEKYFAIPLDTVYRLHDTLPTRCPLAAQGRDEMETITKHPPTLVLDRGSIRRENGELVGNITNCSVAFARELLIRYNAHDELVAALRLVLAIAEKHAPTVNAAPELYEALRDALTMCETLAGACSDRVHGTGKEIYRLRQVLAKVDHE
jgi:hypothetical protein